MSLFGGGRGRNLKNTAQSEQQYVKRINLMVA